MEILQIPISAVVTIVACCSAIAVTALNPSFNTDPMISQSISQKAYYSTHAERLLRRYLSGEELAYERLFHETQAAYGDKAGQELLKTIEASINSETDHELRGRLYTLRGILLMEVGSKEMAVESFQAALNLNPLNKTAADALNTTRGIGGGRPVEAPSSPEKSL
jgi:tetratricopeptide (TPR) repeat protein